MDDGQSVRAWSHGDLLLEVYRYAPGPIAAPDTHAHETYQLSLSLDAPGEYRWRGGSHPVPVGAVTVIHPGEAHRSHDDPPFESPATYRMVYLPPSLFPELLDEPERERPVEPFFPGLNLADPPLLAAFLALSVATERRAPVLEQEERLATLLGRLVALDPAIRFRPRVVGREDRAVDLVRDYLAAHPAANVPLRDLARLAGLSPNHLAHVFSRRVGMPPHAYHLAVRIDAAKRGLLAGLTPAAAAAATGFCDQSHLASHFKRLVRTTPGRYTAP